MGALCSCRARRQHRRMIWMLRKELMSRTRTLHFIKRRTKETCRKIIGTNWWSGYALSSTLAGWKRTEKKKIQITRGEIRSRRLDRHRAEGNNIIWVMKIGCLQKKANRINWRKNNSAVWLRWSSEFNGVKRKPTVNQLHSQIFASLVSTFWLLINLSLAQNYQRLTSLLLENNRIGRAHSAEANRAKQMGMQKDTCEHQTHRDSSELWLLAFLCLRVSSCETCDDRFFYFGCDGKI